MRPDIGILESNGQFQCQVHFPSLYKSDTEASTFPASDGCIINEIEVFVPVFEKTTSVSFRILKELVSFIFSWIGSFTLEVVADRYDRGERGLARFLSGVCLLFVWLNYWSESLLLLGLSFLLVSSTKWKDSTGRRIPDDIRFEKRLIMFAFVVLVTFMFVFI